MDSSTIAASGSSVAAYAQYYCIRTIFLNVPISDVMRLERGDSPTVGGLNAMFAVADVYMMAGNLHWLDTPSQMPSVAAEESGTIGPKYPRFKGIVYDIEPQAYSTWSSDRLGTIQRYFQLLDTMFGSSQPATYAQTILATAPYFATQTNATGAASPTMLQSVESLPKIYGTYMMDYETPASTQLSYARSAFAQMRKPYWIGSTTDRRGGTSSYYGSTQASLLSNMQALSAGAQNANSGLAGVSVNAWNTEGNSLQTVLPQP